jgi:hypothetical protein
MLGGKDGKGANCPPMRDERLWHRLYQVLGSFDGVQKVVRHLLVRVYFFPYEPYNSLPPGFQDKVERKNGM